MESWEYIAGGVFWAVILGTLVVFKIARLVGRIRSRDGGKP